jgi:hypothetical protein
VTKLKGEISLKIVEGESKDPVLLKIC